MNKELYEMLKTKYGNTSSFALWAEAKMGEKSNIGDLSIFEDETFPDQIHANYVLIDMLPNNQRRDKSTTAWRSFHSDMPRQNEYKLRYALKNTPLWGSYMTSFIKETKGVPGRIAQTNPDILNLNITLLKEELSLFEHPVLIALGGNVYKHIRAHFQDDYKIIVVKHPSFDIKLDEYKKEIIEKASL